MLLFSAVGATRILSAAQSAPPSPFLTVIGVHLHRQAGAWCWQDICPGGSGLEQAAHTLRPYGAVTAFDAGRHLQWRSSGDPSLEVDLYGYEAQARVTLIVFDLAYLNLTVGEVLPYLGVPTLIALDENTIKATPTLCFRGSVCVHLRESSRLTPHARIEHLYLLASPTDQPAVDRPLEAMWHGFVDVQRCMVIFRRFSARCP